MANKKDETGTTIEELLEEIKRLKAQLAEKSGVETAPAAHETDDRARGEELISFTLPFTGENAEPLFVGVNGENIRIRPGEPVMIKRKFADAISLANRQRLEAWRMQQAEQERGRKALSEL